jgi:uncharacterized membrane protein
VQSFSIARPLPWLISIGAIVLFLSSSVKHALFQSNAWDLGIFDQAVYLISQGKPAISSFLEFHILADHVALVLYPLALLYRIVPNVHWLLAVQAIALALGCLPTYLLARQAGLKAKTSVVLAVVYLLYPLVFNLSMADFHPEVLAIPAMLQAVYAARCNQRWWFGIWILLILSCKAPLALTVIAMGIWLLVFERRSYGLSAIVAGIIWFVIATKWVIPTFGGAAAGLDRHAFRYAYLGNSLPEMARNVLSNPGLVLGRIFAGRTIDYLFLLMAPILWAVPSLKFAPLIGAVPVFLMNVLSTHAGQRNLIDQYAVPILPFLILMAIAAFSSERSILPKWKIPNSRLILVWSILTFLVFAKYLFFFDYIEKLDNWQATRSAIAQVPAQAKVLTDFRLAPHLSHRSTIRLVNSARTYLSVKPERAAEFDYVLLDLRHPWQSDRALIQKWIDTLNADSRFRLQFESDQIFLFKRGET